MKKKDSGSPPSKEIFFSYDLFMCNFCPAAAALHLKHLAGGTRMAAEGEKKKTTYHEKENDSNTNGDISVAAFLCAVH